MGMGRVILSCGGWNAFYDKGKRGKMQGRSYPAAQEQAVFLGQGEHVIHHQDDQRGFWN